jgi:hypothetical protein
MLLLIHNVLQCLDQSRIEIVVRSFAAVLVQLPKFKNTKFFSYEVKSCILKRDGREQFGDVQGTVFSLYHIQKTTNNVQKANGGG